VESNGGFLIDGAEFVMFLCGMQLELGSSVLAVPDLNEVDAMLKCADTFKLALPVDICSAGGCCCC
jgi:hypothetical protein